MKPVCDMHNRVPPPEEIVMVAELEKVEQWLGTVLDDIPHQGRVRSLQHLVGISDNMVALSNVDDDYHS